MNKTIYNAESEVCGNRFYKWNAIMKYAGETIRLTVCFGECGDFVRISKMTENGWVVVADDWCLNFDRAFEHNPYKNTNEVMVYTRKIFEKAMLNFIVDFFGKEAWVDNFVIKDHIKEDIDTMNKPKEANEHTEYKKNFNHGWIKED